MFEEIILKNLITDVDYTRKYVSYLNTRQFGSNESKHFVHLFSDYYSRYGELPTCSQLKVELTKNKKINDTQLNDIAKYLDYINEQPKERHTFKWLQENTETWIRDRELEHAIIKCAEIIQSDESREEIPNLIRDAYKISFDEDMGVELFDEKTWRARHQRYNEKALKFATSFEKFNLVTGGGFEPKTVNIFMAGTNVGKTTVMAAMAADFIRKGYDVLYFTMEMAQEKISQRIESNLFNTPTNDLKDLPEDIFCSRLNEIKNKTNGRLIVKEFPTSMANVNHLRRYLDDIEIKAEFRPVIVFVDYISIMSSVRIKNDSLYQYNKAIIEELRGLAVERNLCVFSAIQTNRSGFGSSDASLTDSAESWGIPATADFQCALISNEELEKQNLMIVKILKNRYSGIKNYRFPLRTHMECARFTELNEHENQNVFLNNNEEAVKKVKEVQSRQKVKNLKMKFD